MEITQLKKYYGSILFFASVLFGLWAVSAYSYLLFHSIAEIFSIVVAFGIFVLAWNSRRFADNTYLPFIGVAYLFVAGLDLLHTLAYKGMGVFEGYGSNLATQLWISARYIESASLLLATFLIGRKLRVKLTLAGYALLTALLLASIFYWDVFPTCYIEGQGLTAFKKISEYIICFLLVGSISMLLRHRRAFEPHILQLLVASLGVMIASELAFTLYVNVEGLPNLIGHYFKIISFYLIYKAIIQTGLTKPFALLLRDLKKSEEALKAAKENLEIEVDARTAELRQSQEELESRVHERTAELEQAKEKLEREIIERKGAEEELRRAHDQWEHTFEAVPDLICILDKAHRILRVNKAVADRIGCAPKDLVGRHCYEVMHGGKGPVACCPHTQLLADGQEHWVEIHEDRLKGDFSICVTPLRNADGEPTGAVHVAHDITKRKQAEETLRRSEQELAIRNKIAQIFLTVTDEQIYAEILRVILEAMESKHGVFGYLNEDGAFVCPSLTRDIWDQCQVVEKNYTFPRESWGGIWGRAMIEKKTLCSNASFAVPAGHIPVMRALDVPLVYQGKLIGNLLVGNKPIDYNEKDRQLLETIADYIAPILGARLEKDRWERQRKEASDALQKARDELEIRVEERTAELARSREALWRLAGRLLSVQEEERRRLARELHDDLTQRLAVLAIEAGKLEQQVGAAPGKLRDKLRQMKEQMVKLSADVHDISRQLHPSIIDDLGLRQAIQSECVNFTKREGIVIRYEPKDIPPKIPRDISICLFRIVQEGLRNIARHAKVEEAKVRLVGGDKRITLIIEDSGIGFEPAKARGEAGLGLVSMEERVRLIQGELRVNSKPGEGTIINVTAPL